MTNDEWQQVIRWLHGLGLRVLSIDTQKRQVLIELPPTRE